MTKLRHVLGLSGGKDSTALAIYLKKKYPYLDIEYYFCDTGKELDDTYRLLESLESYLGPIKKLESEEAKKSDKDPFDYFYNMYRGYLPSSQARWCTKELKLRPFENFVGTDQTVSYVGIRGDEDREGYISKKSNIQSIFPFRRNIWSEDVINKILYNKHTRQLAELYEKHLVGKELDKVIEIIRKPFAVVPNDRETTRKNRHAKLNDLLDVSVVSFNHVVFDWLRGTNYPLSLEETYPLLDNEEVLLRQDIFDLLEESGIGLPAYYNKIEFEVDKERGYYARSRSGCFFCFFQQKIEWIWLYEQHPDLFAKAMKYENEDEGFLWNQDESLKDLTHPLRMTQIKQDHLRRGKKAENKNSKYLMDILVDSESVGCPACFI
jgi:3'-phosphoadenosine 5'-phosphosulfate sulfotransferase (PAPS reductase)/FAD synthetase